MVRGDTKNVRSVQPEENQRDYTIQGRWMSWRRIQKVKRIL